MKEGSKNKKQRTDVFLKKVLSWIAKHPKDFTEYPQISTDDIKKNIKSLEEINNSFYETLGKFHAIKKEEKEKKRFFQKEYKKIIEEIKRFYKKDPKKVAEFKVGKRGVLLDEKLVRLEKVFRKKEAELQGQVKYSLLDVQSLLEDFKKFRREITKIQKEILRSRRLRSKTFNDIQVFSRKYRHIILARYAGSPDKKKAFSMM